jgi:Methionine biosynthesis protein MetW
MKSFVYWHPYFYRSAMKMLYGRYFEARYRAIADIIPERATVIELCAGDGYLYQNYLKHKVVTYSGLEINPIFVKAAQRKNIPISIHDIVNDSIPSADYVIIQASLYQFIPNENQLIRKLLEATTIALIVAEPVINLAASSNPILRTLAKYSANPGKDHALNRFNKDTLFNCFRNFPEFQEMKSIDGGREMIGVFRK